VIGSRRNRLPHPLSIAEFDGDLVLLSVSLQHSHVILTFEGTDRRALALENRNPIC
jgi:hypothetical protein